MSSSLIEKLKRELPNIERIPPLKRPVFKGGPFTLTLRRTSRFVPGKKMPSYWDESIDGEWEGGRDSYVDEVTPHFFYNLDYKVPVLPEDRKRITRYIEEYYDPEDFGPWSDYNIEGFYNSIKNDLNRLWMTMGASSFLTEYLRRLREIPGILDTYRPLIKKVEEDRDVARSWASFKEFVYSRKARRLPESMLRLIGGFLAVS